MFFLFTNKTKILFLQSAATRMNKMLRKFQKKKR